MTSVLIIKINQLGDTIIDLPMIEAIVSEVSAKNVYVLTTPIAAGVFKYLLPEENLLVMSRDEFNGAWKSPGHLYKIYSWLKRLSPEWVIIPSDQGNVARLLARYSGCKNVIEMSNIGVKFSASNCEVSPSPAMVMQENNWKLYQEFIKLIGWDEVPKIPPRPSITFEGLRWCGDFSGAVLIHSGSSREATRWGAERFIALANKLANAGRKVIWMDEGDAKPPKQNNIEILKRRPLHEFASIASNCSLFIGNNSGPMHLCDVLGVPLLILCGPVSRDWDPYWSKYKKLIRDETLECQPCETCDARMSECIRKVDPFACMSRVTVDSVFDEAENLLLNF